MRLPVLGMLFIGASLLGCAGQTKSAPLAPGDPWDPQASASAPLVTAAEPGERSGARAEQRDGRWVSAAATSDFMLAGQREQAFGVWIDVPRQVNAAHVPSAISLAIDTSGSMKGEKIQHARDAARRIVKELDDGDLLSIVTFDQRGRVRLAATPIDDRSRRRALSTIDELLAEGGTAMFEGLKIAEAQLWSTPETHLVRRMIVISDGIATVGPSSPTELARVAEVGLQRGIQVTSIGVGLDYDESTLNELAIQSSGRLYHVEHSRQLASIVGEEMAQLESTVAAQVEIELVAAPGVRLIGTDAARSRWSDGKLFVPVGTVFGGQQRELLVRAVVDEAKEGSKVLASVRMHYRDLSEDGVARVQETVLRTTVTRDAALVAAHANSRAQTLVAMRDASVAAHRASASANRGDLAAAEADLEIAERKLRHSASMATNKHDKARIMKSAKKMRRRRDSVEKASAAPAATRGAASRAAALDLNDDVMEDRGF